MPKTINKIQMIQFELLEHMEASAVAGKHIVADLIKHKELWDAVLTCSDTEWPLQHLPDLAGNRWNVDALYILSSGVDNVALLDLARQWRPIKAEWIAEYKLHDLMATATPPKHPVLRCWW